jgi:hypothetical protein
VFFFSAAYYTNYRLAFQMDYNTLNSPSAACQTNYASQLTSRMVQLTSDLTALCNTISPPVTVSPAANTNPVTVTSYNTGVRTCGFFFLNFFGVQVFSVYIQYWGK